MASRDKSVGEFDFLTKRQAAVLDQLLHGPTSKEIAHRLGISETSVNRRIEIIRARFGGVQRQEVVRRYRLWCANRNPAQYPEKTPETSPEPCVETEREILQLARTGAAVPRSGRDSEAAPSAFEDPVAMSIDAPWREWKEPRIVPRVLDGDNATLTRGAAIALLLVAIIASLVLVLAAAQGLADAVS